MPTQSSQSSQILTVDESSGSPPASIPKKPALIHWPAVAAAGALALLLVAVFTASAWILSRSSRTGELRTGERHKRDPLLVAGDGVHVVVDQTESETAGRVPPARIERPAQPNQEPVGAPEQLAMAGGGIERPAARAVPSTDSSAAAIGSPVAQFGAETQAPVRCETFGTRVQFVRNPAEAGWLANRDRKLVFLPQISGNFEDQRFT